MLKKKINKTSLYTFRIMSDIHDLNEREREKKNMCLKYTTTHALTIGLKLILKSVKNILRLP